MKKILIIFLLIFIPFVYSISWSGGTVIVEPDTNATTACDGGEYLDGGGPCFSVNDTIDRRTASITYNASSIATYEGTLDAGDLASVQAIDGDWYNVSENAGANSLLVEVNFTGIETFSNVLLRLQYEGGLGHEIEIQVWNFDSSEWETLGEITDQSTMTEIVIDVLDSVDHVSGGEVGVRFDHQQNGNPSHNLFLDYVALQEGFTSITISEHDGLLGRDDMINNHPDMWNFTNLMNNTFSPFAYNQSLWNISGTNLFQKNLNYVLGINTTTPQNTLNIVGDFNVTRNSYCGGDLDVDGTTNLDVTDIDDTLMIAAADVAGDVLTNSIYERTTATTLPIALASQIQTKHTAGSISQAVGYFGGFQAQSNGGVTTGIGVLGNSQSADGNTPTVLIMQGVIGTVVAEDATVTHAASIQGAAPSVDTGSIAQSFAGWFDGDVAVTSNNKLILEATLGAKGDSYLTFVSASPRIDLFVDGNNGATFTANERLGISQTNPSYPLEINANVSDISVYAQTNYSGTGYIVRSSVFNKDSGSAFDFIKDASYYLTNGIINHKNFYGYTSYDKMDKSRPIYVDEVRQVCKYEDIYNKELDKSFSVCTGFVNETYQIVTYPYTINEEGVSLGSEIDVLRQAVYELKQDNEMMKQDLCSFGIIRWC